MNAAPSVWILVIRAASGVVPLRAAARLMAPTVPVTIWFISVTAHGAQAVMNRQPTRMTETSDSFDIRMELRMERMGRMGLIANSPWPDWPLLATALSYRTGISGPILSHTRLHKAGAHRLGGHQRRTRFRR